VHDILEGLPVERMMRSNALTCLADCSVSRLVHEHIMGMDDHAFPVLDDGRLIGLVTVESYLPLASWLRETLTQEPALELIGEARSGQEGIRLAERLSPDILIADLNLPDMRGLEFVRWIVHTLPKIKVIVLSDYDSPRYYDVCSREGAMACISKDAMALELIMTIRKALGEGI
jgi:CheY-like chemotaxis protein